MEESSPMPQAAKIALGIALLFCAAFIICVAVGTPLFVNEQYKVLFYTKDLCHVKSASYQTIHGCIHDGGRKTVVTKCYLPVWQVELSQNVTHGGTIRGNAEESSNNALTASDHYQVGSSYACWYNKKKRHEITWYKPTTYYALILLIIGGICIPFTVISFVAFYRLRKRADL
ncbi:unnamed protein product [Rotaria magnacalcarata]|uniref:Uncharacterized protein n=2 Tax=Rotaria magnacalcarata TaxID=392030 RepID=A0A816H635_9BILA|nr:unnamed protein product [Rotaria magnacalcarata]CAF1681945.1 unnamed protein product [Rotaria magnacalcarata]CAF2198722.1 unnamed protein product [Rotaria magnacalcarata]CAF4012710.1 unnamed protein product [Rotaria magnacalcarata]CAF4025861.1 unnamed protein product [Rotaria magnacalcarata]